MSQDSSLLINIQETLRFFDEKPAWASGNVTASRPCSAKIVGSVSATLPRKQRGLLYQRPSRDRRNGSKKGPRLDRWIEADLADGHRVLFQTEIKSWSAWAIGGKPLAVDASQEEVEDYKHWYWEGQWDTERHTLKHHYVGKVLVPMTPKFDTQGRQQIPLLIYWAVVGPNVQTAMQPQGSGGHLFTIANPSYDFPFVVPASWPERHPFSELWMFSVSSYLRSIEQDKLKLKMPIAASRMKAVTRLAETVDD